VPGKQEQRDERERSQDTAARDGPPTAVGIHLTVRTWIWPLSIPGIVSNAPEIPECSAGVFE